MLWLFLAVIILETAIAGTFQQNEYSTIKRGWTEMSIYSTTKKHNVKFDYKICLDSMPYYIEATANPKYSTGVEKFNVTVVQINFYNAVLELERIDQDSGWEDMLFTVQWTIYHISDYITSMATVQYRVDYETDLNVSETFNVSAVYGQGLSSLPSLQSNPQLQPRLSQKRQNGHRFLLFENKLSRLVTNLNLNKKQGENDLFTVFIVYRLDAVMPPGSYDWIGLFGIDNLGYDKYIGLASDKVVVSGTLGNSIKITSTRINANPRALRVWNVLSVQWNVDGGVDASSVWCNGKLLQRFQARTSASDTRFTIGDLFPSGRRSFRGAIGEFVLFKSIVITDEVMKKYQLHFIHKWGITADPIPV
uniref:uncharacterized protein LOC113474801 n=1 Tax=Ciona intestinalis TaxID=7719 RepID=UPI000EF46EC4|nr:uncharacterized protein LOC113474801 [Ciona intestinalis]|eukprot:XP_026693067.1 uncharacterized protein LOC113474801 [Ciona intestinalis]